MTIALWIIALAFLTALVWLLSQPASFEVVRSRTINASANKLYSTVVDLKTWPEWSPWLIHEPDTTLKYSEDTTSEKSWYSWDGQIVGAGKIIHLTLDEPNSIHQHIEFLRPFSSQSKVNFSFEAVGDNHTKVSWTMQGGMPFLFRWMNSKMDHWVGPDYELGLARLAAYVSEDEEPIELRFFETVMTEGCHYIFDHFEGSVDDMATAMRQTFPSLHEATLKGGLELSSPPFTLYHQFDPIKKTVSCDMCIPIQEGEQVDGYSSASLAGRKYLRSELRGSYEFLEQAWHASFSHLRMKKHALEKGVPMIERYISDPNENTGINLITQIDLPVKS